MGLTLAALCVPTQSLLSAQRSPEKAPVSTVYKSLPEVEGHEVESYTRLLHSIPGFHSLYVDEFHPEYKLDFSGHQQAILAQQKPCEFTSGYLFQARDSLSKILVARELPPNSYLTRVPQTWALQQFDDQEKEPAIFVIDALQFNREMASQRAVLQHKKEFQPEGIKDCKIRRFFRIFNALPLYHSQQFLVDAEKRIEPVIFLEKDRKLD